MLVHDGFGLWLSDRRLHQGGFIWDKPWQGERLTLTPEQLQGLVIGLPWHQDNHIAMYFTVLRLHPAYVSIVVASTF